MRRQKRVTTVVVLLVLVATACDPQETPEREYPKWLADAHELYNSALLLPGEDARRPRIFVEIYEKLHPHLATSRPITERRVQVIPAFKQSVPADAYYLAAKTFREATLASANRGVVLPNYPQVSLEFYRIAARKEPQTMRYVWEFVANARPSEAEANAQYISALQSLRKQAFTPHQALGVLVLLDDAYTNAKLIPERDEVRSQIRALSQSGALRPIAGVRVEGDRAQFPNSLLDFDSIPEPDGLVSTEHLRMDTLESINDDGTVKTKNLGAITLIGISTADLPPPVTTQLVSFLREHLKEKPAAIEQCPIRPTANGKPRAMLYVQTGNTWVNVNHFLIQNGFATFKDEPRCHAYFSKYIRLEAEGKASKRGMWAK